MSPRRPFGWSARFVILGAMLVACSSTKDSPDPPNDASEDCASLQTTLDEAKLAVKLSTDLSTHDDSDGGVTVTAQERDEIQAHEDDEATAQAAFDNAGC